MVELLKKKLCKSFDHRFLSSHWPPCQTIFDNPKHIQRSIATEWMFVRNQLTSLKPKHLDEVTWPSWCKCKPSGSLGRSQWSNWLHSTCSTEKVEDFATTSQCRRSNIWRGASFLVELGRNSRSIVPLKNHLNQNNLQFYKPLNETYLNQIGSIRVNPISCSSSQFAIELRLIDAFTTSGRSFYFAI